MPAHPKNEAGTGPGFPPGMITPDNSIPRLYPERYNKFSILIFDDK